MAYLIGFIGMSIGFGFGWALGSRVTERPHVISLESRRMTRANVDDIAAGRMTRQREAVDNDAIDWSGAA